MSELRVGAAKVVITPPLGCGMAGYAARDHGAEGVADELYARAIYLEQEDRRALILSLDVCYLAADVEAAARQAIAERLGIPLVGQFLCASHTHTGPQTTGGEIEQRYAASLIDRLVGVAGWAMRRAVPATARFGRGPVRVGGNRRERRPDGHIILGYNPAGSTLDFVDVALFETVDGQPVASWFSHASHPTTLGAVYDFSADFPGRAAAMIEAELGCPALFLQGCCGDINPDPRGTFAEVALHGRRLGHAALSTIADLEPARAIDRLAVGDHLLGLPLDPAPSPADADAELAAAEAEVAALPADASPGVRWRPNRRLAAARDTADLIRAGDLATTRPVTISQLRLDDRVLVALPTEIFSSLSRRIAAGTSLEATVLGYVNGWFGYLPDAPVWDEGGYEYDVRIRWRGLPIARHAGDVLVDEALRMLG